MFIPHRGPSTTCRARARARTAPVKRRGAAGQPATDRTWLAVSANNVLGFEGERAVLVDSGYVSQRRPDRRPFAPRPRWPASRAAPSTLPAAFRPYRLQRGGTAPSGCDITVPGRHGASGCRVERGGLLLSIAAQDAERDSGSMTPCPRRSIRDGALEWQAYAAPGHDMDALVSLNFERLLISGDALARRIRHPLFVEVLSTADGLAATARDARGDLASWRSIWCCRDWRRLRRVRRAAMMPEPLRDCVAFGRTAGAWPGAIPAPVTFMLLERRNTLIDSLPAHLDAVPLYREANRRFLGLGADALAKLADRRARTRRSRAREGERLVAMPVAPPSIFLDALRWQLTRAFDTTSALPLRRASHAVSS